MQTEQYSQAAEPQANSVPAAPPASAPSMVPPGMPGADLQSQHPDRNTQRGSRDQQVALAQNQVAALMQQMQQMQGTPMAQMSEEEQHASEVMKKRMERIMGGMNEESTETGEPQV